MANKDLFEQNNISIPTNYSEFLAAIDAFEAMGIKGFQIDWTYDYSCLETMQGCSIPVLMSLEGTQWRMEYESENEDVQASLDAGMNGYLSKPIVLDEVIKTVARNLN